MSYQAGLKLIDENSSYSKILITKRNKNLTVSVECKHPGFSKKIIHQLIKYGWSYNPDYRRVTYIVKHEA